MRIVLPPIILLFLPLLTIPHITFLPIFTLPIIFSFIIFPSSLLMLLLHPVKVFLHEKSFMTPESFKMFNEEPTVLEFLL